MDLKRVPINRDTVRTVTDVLQQFQILLDEELILEKNAEYGDSWQAEGPFVAAGRMKDKLVRVETLIDEAKRTRISQTTSEGGFVNILEMMAYGRMLMLYWVYNDLGIKGDESDTVDAVYEEIRKRLGRLTKDADATGSRVDGD